jgi:hypothetical protein
MTINITADPVKDLYDPEEVVTLTADMPGATSPTFEWSGDDNITPKTGATVSVKMKKDAGEYDYSVKGTPQTGGAETKAFKLRVKAAGAPAPAPNPEEDAPDLLVFKPWFAVAAGLLVVAALVAFALPLHKVLYKLVDRVTKDEQDLSKVIGGLIGLSLVLIGAIVIVGGLYGGLLEVRGRLRTKDDLEIDKAAAGAGLATKGAVIDPKGFAVLVDAIGKLRGAALILVIGCVPLIAAAWIGHAAVDTPSPTTSTTQTTAGTDTTQTTLGTDTTQTTLGTDTTATTLGSDVTQDTATTGGGDSAGVDWTLPPPLLTP